jgi:hypothetical protein
MGLLLATMVCISCASATGDSGSSIFVVSVPTNWANAARIRLVLEGATVPGNIPLKLRVTTSQGEQEMFIGSTGIEALGPDESKPRHLPLLMLDVTRSIKRLLESRPGGKRIEVRIQPVDGRNHPIPGLKWSCEKVRLEIQDKSNRE